MFVNNVTCLQQQQQPLAIHYDRDHSHCIVSSNVLVGRGGANVIIIIIIIYTGYDVIQFCPVIAIANVRMRTNLAGLIVERATLLCTARAYIHIHTCVLYPATTGRRRSDSSMAWSCSLFRGIMSDIRLLRVVDWGRGLRPLRTYYDEVL